MEIYKWKGMVLGALGCMNNVDFEKKVVNDNIVLDVFIYLSEITACKSKLKKIPYSYLYIFKVIPQSIHGPL